MSDTIYRPLSTGMCQIRLLNLQPDRSGHPQISGSVHVANLESPPKYEAISYAWGEVEPSGSMLLNGVKFPIPKGLEEALKHFCVSQTPRTLWADAICINQKDNAEKVAQIKLMGRIYHAATRALVWLGPREDEDDDFVFRTLNRLASPDPISVQQIILERAGYWTQPQLLSKFKLDQLWSSLPDDEATEAGKGILSLLCNFFILPWWDRVWVLEEVALAPGALLFWGHEHIDFDQVVSACDTLILDLRQNLTTLYNILTDDEIQEFRDCLATSMITAKQVKHISNRIHNPAEYISQRDMCLSVIEMLAIGRPRRAYHKRDKVFGLLGLFPRELIQSFQPDYTVPTELIFQDTAFNLLNLSESFMLFNCIIEGEVLTPSWCPQWDHRHHQLQDFGLRAQQESLFHTCGNSPWDLVRQPSAPVLEVTGFCLDRLSRTVQPRTDILDSANLVIFLEDCVRHTDDDLFKIAQFRFRIQHYRQQIYSTKYITSENVLQAICRIALNDCEPTGAPNGLIRRLSAENFDCFYQWLLTTEHDSVYDEEVIASAEDMCFEGVERPSMCTFARSVLSGKAFFTTELGYAGLVDEDYQAKTGEVWILAGGSQPVVLQPVLGRQGSFHVVSEAYVHGIMDGEATAGKVPTLNGLGSSPPLTATICLV